MRFILKKAGTFAVTLLIISFVTFMAFQLIPGDPATSRLGTSATPERVEALREELGLNRPVMTRYVEWLGGFVTGDSGMSYKYASTVGELLENKLIVTVVLSLMSFIIMVAISLPLGIILTRYEGGWLDRIMVAINQIVMSIPSFLVGVVFVSVFGLMFKLFTAGEFVYFSDSPAGFFGYLFFPALAIALPKAAMALKLLRSSILSEMKQDYVRTAYSRGNSRWSVLSVHVLRNAIIPYITFIAMAFADIFAGSIIIEQIFAIPGIGRLLVSSISNRDYPVVQTVVVIIAFIVVLANLIADVAYRYIDPRVRLD